MNAAEIDQAATDLHSAYALLREATADLILVPQPGPARSAIKEVMRIQIGNVERHLGCLRDALNYTIADDLEASKQTRC